MLGVAVAQLQRLDDLRAPTPGRVVDGERQLGAFALRGRAVDAQLLRRDRLGQESACADVDIAADTITVGVIFGIQRADVADVAGAVLVGVGLVLVGDVGTAVVLVADPIVVGVLARRAEVCRDFDVDVGEHAAVARAHGQDVDALDQGRVGCAET